MGRKLLKNPLWGKGRGIKPDLKLASHYGIVCCSGQVVILWSTVCMEGSSVGLLHCLLRFFSSFFIYTQTKNQLLQVQRSERIKCCRVWGSGLWDYPACWVHPTPLIIYACSMQTHRIQNSAGTLIAEMALHDCNSHCHYTTCTDCYRVDSKIFAHIMVNNMIDINKTGKMKLKCDCDELSLMNC